VQLYFAGAKVVSYYPVSIPSHSMALNVTVQSYNGRLDYGLIACRRAVPDVNDLADALLSEHRTLMELAQVKPTVAGHIAAPVEKLPQLTAKAPARKRAKRVAVAG
jgi:hypothetical protein